MPNIYKYFAVLTGVMKTINFSIPKKSKLIRVVLNRAHTFNAISYFYLLIGKRQTFTFDAPCVCKHITTPATYTGIININYAENMNIKIDDGQLTAFLYQAEAASLDYSLTLFYE